MDVDAPFLVLWGQNGVGKTNLLEAIAVLCTGRSFRLSAWPDLMRWGEASADAALILDGPSGTRRLRVHIESKGRTFMLDGAPVRDLGHYLQAVRAVVFTPEDTGIIRGSPDLRRRFMDRAAFNCWPVHLNHVRDFSRALAQKSALLRSERVNRQEMAAWNERLAVLGARVSRGRSRLVEALEAPLDRVHRLLSEGAVAALRYRSVLGDGEESGLADCYLALLQRSAEEEIRRGLNLVGPQRDDLEIRFQPTQTTQASGTRSALPLARAFASQGQVRTLALSLKLAELVVAGSNDDPPVMLLDDLSSELDGERLGRLVGLLEELKAQVVVTTTDPGPILQRLSGPGQTVRMGPELAEVPVSG